MSLLRTVLGFTAWVLFLATIVNVLIPDTGRRGVQWIILFLSLALTALSLAQLVGD
jgi:uncharacterized membrane protein